MEPAAQCRELGRESGGRLVAESKVRALGIVVGHPVRDDDGAGMVEPVKQRLVQELVAHLRVDGLADPVPHIGSPGEMKCPATPAASVQPNIAFKVNSLDRLYAALGHGPISS